MNGHIATGGLLAKAYRSLLSRTGITTYAEL